MDKQQQARIEHLEEALAHLTRLTDDLSEVIARQDAEIARLTRLVEMLMRAEAEREADTGSTVPLADQRPPHW
ncbi:SlyX family protein [Paracoccus alkanivorans]|uniref:SlyX protein n=1 Tax=Paracoccus alkanivorans TaxID=2116655 RepID=A0A3M0MJD6_9RHOB|nr:SlyX family protein [Paracoccus alkanivorans]RMC37688.1 SlyX protein [Paracoccus alkanivorans]